MIQNDADVDRILNASQYLRILKDQGEQQVSLLMLAASNGYDDIMFVFFYRMTTLLIKSS